MRHQRRPHRRPLAWTAVVVLVPLVLALALPALALADEPKYVVQNASTSCLNPDVSGDLFVWEDMAGNQDIWGKIGSGSPFAIVQNSASVQQTPAVDGTTVVWADDRASGGVYKIYGATVNLSTGAVAEFPISTTAGVKSDPDVSGRYVVWVNYVSATNTYDIYGYDLLTAQEFSICTNSAKQIAPAISGDLVVWQDYRNNATYADIYAARITAGHGISEFPVCAQTVAPMHLDAAPAVNGGTVVWLDGRGGGNARIYAATVTGTTVSGEWQVSTTITRSAGNPAVNGTLIAWTYSGGTSYDDIYARRTDQSAEFPIASTSQYERFAAVGASHTVWTNSSLWDIHAADIGGFGWSAGVAIDGGATYATSRNVTLGLSASSGVGVATQMSLSTNGTDWGGWETYATSRGWELTAGDGTKTVYAMFKDAEGNVSPVKSDSILLDQNAPVTSADAPTGWSQGDATVTLSSDDGAGSGVQAIVREIDDKGVDTYTGPLTVTGDGVHTVRYCAVDLLGHTEEWKTVQVRIDATAPVTSDNAGGVWHGSGFMLVLDGYDAVQLDHTEYSLDGVTWTTGSAPTFAVGCKRGGAAAAFTVHYRSVDSAGNVEETRTCEVKIDRKRPATSNDYDGLVHATDVTVNLTGDDPESGVKETWYAVDGGAWTQGNAVLLAAPVNGSNDGAHTVAYFSVDNMGNVEMTRSVVVLIDATP